MTYKGDNAILGYKIETVFDETPTVSAQTTWIGIVPNADFSDEPEFKDYWTINSDRDRYLENQGKINVVATLPIDLQNGRAVYLAMGALSNTGSNPYTHTLTGTATIPSICIEAQYTGTNRFLRYYRGSKINTLDIEAVDSAEVKASATFAVARGEKSGNVASTISPVATKPYMYHQGAVVIDGVSTYNVTSFKWTVNNNLKVRHTIRSTDGQFARLIIEGKRDYDMTANIILTDTTTINTKPYDTLLSGTTFTTTVTLTRGASDTATLTASNCTIRSAPHNIPEPGAEVEVTVTFKPRTCQWVFVDAITTYA